MVWGKWLQVPAPCCCAQSIPGVAGHQQQVLHCPAPALPSWTELCSGAVAHGSWKPFLSLLLKMALCAAGRVWTRPRPAEHLAAAAPDGAGPAGSRAAVAQGGTMGPRKSGGRKGQV